MGKWYVVIPEGADIKCGWDSGISRIWFQISFKGVGVLYHSMISPSRREVTIGRDTRGCFIQHERLEDMDLRGHIRVRLDRVRLKEVPDG